jgi:cytochrome c-type biogenesis protein CcmE
MRRKVTKLIAGGVILLLAIGYLAYAGMKEGWTAYHLPVDEYVKDAKYHGQRVRLAGKAAEEGLKSHPGLMKAEFMLLGETEKVAVAYTGVIPDLFKADVEVVVEGRRDASGVFQADVLMTKCASKYKSKDHAGK